jgi:hypothetical protein
MSGSKVLVALRVAATPEEAFEIFTKEIGAWWQPNSLFHFTPRSPGMVRFEGEAGGRFVEELPNGKVFEIGRVKIWEPGARLVFGWRQATFRRDQDTEVEVRFEPVGAETRVTVEHRGWDSIPKDHAARHGFSNVVLQKREGEWWHSLLTRFKSRVSL